MIAVVLGAAALTTLGGHAAAPVQAADAAPRMDAAVLLQGHARVGTWMGIEVRVRNDGPAVVGELRIAAGAQGRTRYATPVDLPTGSDKRYLLYGQPPAFGRTLDVELVDGSRTITTAQVAFTTHDAAQPVVGVIAERPERIMSRIDLEPAAEGQDAAVVPLGLHDLPERAEAWSTLDRLVWQDADSNELSSDQLDALRSWIAGGGRLVIVGGTAGGATLAGLPDDLLPYRPTTTLEAPADSLTGLLGDVPDDAPDVAALAGPLARGRALASVGDQAIAAEAAFGLGGVTILGFDPGAGWIGELDAVEALWRRVLPGRASTMLVSGDDNGMVNAVSQLPALALPPIGGMLGLLAGYILLIGPVNYLVLRRLDRREWAWFTMPILIVIFAAGAYAYGAVLRGLDVIVNEVAIVRGAPGVTQGSAQVYLGVFSPSRGTYQLEMPDGALLSSTISGEFLGGGGSLDVIQGTPARVRDLTVGFGALRALRAEAPASVPAVSATLRLEGDRLVGSVRNDSAETLERPAVVLGTSVLVLRDMAPGSEQSVNLAIRPNAFGQSLSDRIFGAIFLGGEAGANETAQRNLVRHSVIDQLTIDPVFGTSAGLPAEQPVLLAWGRGQVVDVRVSGQVPRRTGNVLYYLPLSMTVGGDVAFTGELVRSSMVSNDAAFFNKDPFQIGMGRGSATLAYRPVPFDGELTPSRVLLAMTFGDGTFPNQPTSSLAVADPQPCRDEATDAPGCAEPEPPECDPLMEDCFVFEGVPDLDLYDRSSATWLRMERPEAGQVYELDAPERYLDPATGTLLVRFVNERSEQVGFAFQVRIEGTVR